MLQVFMMSARLPSELLYVAGSVAADHIGCQVLTIVLIIALHLCSSR